MASKLKKKVLIVGGGFAGVAAAKRFLKSSYARKKFEITLIDKNDYQLFHPSLFRVITSDAELSQLFSIAAIKFSEIFKGQEKNIKILNREVEGVSLDKNQILLKVGGVRSKKMDYDYLIMAAGSEREHPYLTLTSFEDAIKIKHEMENAFKNKAKREEINIVVVGGGPTGVELITSLFEYGHKLADKYGHPHKNINFKLIEEGNKILSKHSFWIRKNIEKSLKETEIEVLTKVDAKVWEDKASVLLWAIGAKPVYLSDEFEKTNSKLRSRGRKNVFVVKAPTAQVAMRQGQYIADSIIKKDQKKKTGKFKSKKDFYVIELGEADAFVDFGFMKLKDLPAFWVHKIAFLRYFASILGWGKAIDWLRKYENLK